MLLTKMVLTSAIVVLTVAHVAAQRKKMAYQTPAMLVEVGTKAAAYRGDLDKSFSKWDASFGAALRFNRKKRINFFIEAFYGHLSGQDIFFDPEIVEPGVQPNKFFRTSIFTGSLNAQVNIFKNEWLMVYLSQGAGLMRFSPKDTEGEDLSQQPETRLSSETYTNNSLFLPTQLGAVYLFRSGFGVGLRGGLLNSLTDYLDNISELGSVNGNDNALTWTFTFLIPLEFDYARQRR